jgi:gliding motility-associated-like protein
LLNALKYNQLFSPGFLPGIKSALYLFILLFSFILPTQAQQNLVINGDFEEYTSCPQSVSSPFQNPKEIEKCIGWKGPTYGTSDYFNSCTSNGSVSIPTNSVGEQFAYNGNGYLGALFTSYTGGGGDDGYTGIYWWEYVQGKLVTPLEPGKIYKFSMEVSLSEGSDLMITELGAYFSANPVSSPNTKPLDLSPQCIFYEPNYFRDSVNWIHLETYFTASGGEQFLTIGNFRDSITTDTLRRFDLSPGINPFITYFYIDHVVLIDPSSNGHVGNIFTPNCDGINDLWSFPFPGELKAKKISILNRWGNLVRQGVVKDFSWDGTTGEGKECSDGTYFYRISDSSVAGFIELIR